MIEAFKDLYEKDPPRTRGEHLICRAANVDLGAEWRERAAPKRMSDRDAFAYYGAKLDRIWLRLQCSKIKAYPIEMRRKILSYQKGK